MKGASDSIKHNGLLTHNHMTTGQVGVVRKKLLPCFQNISDSPYCMDKVASERAIDLVSQPENERSHNVGSRIKDIVPNVCHDHRLRYNSSHIPHQMLQQGELFWLQIYLNIISEDLSPYKVYFQIADRQGGWFFLLGCPSDESLTSCSQFRESDRLDQIIVTARLQPLVSIMHQYLSKHS